MTRTTSPKAKVKLRPVPPQKKFPIVAVLIFLLFAIFIIASKLTISETSLEINPHNNKFRLEFQVPKNKKERFSHTLSQLNLPPDLAKGADFELDATSSAALSFASPIRAKLNFNSKQIRINGSTNATQSLYQTETFKLPTSTKVAIFASSVKHLFESQISIPPELNGFIGELFSQKGQLIVFFENDEFLIVTKAQNINFDDLAGIKFSGDEEYYKKELIAPSFETHLLKIPFEKENQKSTLSIFQLGQWAFITSSSETTRRIVDVQKLSKDVLEFPKEKEATLIVLAINPANASFGQIIFNRETDWIDSLASVDRLEFVLKDNKFSGLINLK